REIGIRVALGAERSRVIGLVMKEVAIMAAIGIGVGLPLALALSQYVRSPLFGLEAKDPLTLAIATAAMALVASTAGYISPHHAALIRSMREFGARPDPRRKSPAELDAERQLSLLDIL